MLGNLFNAIEWLVVLAVLFAFVIGAWRHAVEQTLGDPLSVDPALNAKAKRYFTLFGKVLWHIAGLVVMVGGILLEIAAIWAANNETQTGTGGDFRYKHKGERYYTHSTGDGSNSWY